MTSHMAGQIVGHLWDKVRCKFELDEEGLYFNKRLDEEIEKRQKYSLSRRNNLKGINQYNNRDIKSTQKRGHMTSHMENRNENENRNINRDIDKEQKNKFIAPNIDEVKQFFEENGYTNAERAWNYYNDAGWKDSTGKPVKNWKQKMRGVWFREENLKPASKPKRMTSDDIIAEMTEKYKHGIPTQDASSRL
jgi:predicted RND superfamily exporter protein